MKQLLFFIITHKMREKQLILYYQQLAYHLSFN